MAHYDGAAAPGVTFNRLPSRLAPRRVSVYIKSCCCGVGVMADSVRREEQNERTAVYETFVVRRKMRHDFKHKQRKRMQLHALAERHGRHTHTSVYLARASRLAAPARASERSTSMGSRNARFAC